MTHSSRTECWPLCGWYPWPVVSKHIQNPQLLPQSICLEKDHLEQFWPVERISQKPTWCPKKRGISKWYHVWFIAHSIWSLEYSFLIHLKIEIHVLVAKTNPFLRDIKELRNIHPICVFITFSYTVVNRCVKLSTAHTLIVCWHFSQFITFSIVIELIFIYL